MKKTLFALFAVLFVMASAANANPVGRSVAKEIGAKFMRTDDLQYVKSYDLKNGDAAFYVFNTEKGFVIVSADDCATPILAYSTEGRFEEDHIPAPMQDYLNDFVGQIQQAVDYHVVADEYTAHEWELVMTTGHINEQRGTTAVGPLLKSTWDQGYPYNILCPLGAGGPAGHCYVGCTAVAMGQVMRYWGYPKNGQGSYGGIDFGETTYQWNEMPNALYSNSDSTAIMSVATLLWHCGVTLDMEYGTAVSNAAMDLIPDALVTYFKYAPDMEYAIKDIWGNPNYTDEEWFAKLKTSLDLGRPVVYGSFVDGYTDMGHIFVCDGYDENNLLHINWGWGGYGDAYFKIGALHAGGYGFNTCNQAILNIHPEGETGVEEVFNESDVVTYEVFDVLGRRVGDIYKYHKSGVYIIRFTMKSGEVVTKKIVFDR